MERFTFWVGAGQQINASCRECDWRAEFLVEDSRHTIPGAVIRETLESHDCLRDRD